MNKENNDRSLLVPEEELSSTCVDKSISNLIANKTANFIIGTVGVGTNLKDIIKSELSNPREKLSADIDSDIGCSLSEKLSRVEDFIIDKPTVIDSKKKENPIRFYDSFIKVPRNSKSRIK